MKHTGMLRSGTKTLLDAIFEHAGSESPVLWGRGYLGEAAKEATGVDYNASLTGTALIVSSRARPGQGLRALAERKGRFACFSGDSLVAARIEVDGLKPGVLTRADCAKVAKGVELLDGPRDALFEGYWNLVQENGLAIAKQAGRFTDPLAIPDQVEVRGPPSNLRIHPEAEVERHVTFDARLGPIVIGAGAAVESFSLVMGPCFIGPKVKLYSALIGGGTSIFDSCRVGGQVENSILSPFSNKAHNGYVGDSYVGEWVNLGAGCNFSNLKNTYGSVKVTLGTKRLDTGMVKLGPAVGDMSKASIGALVFAGKLLGTGCQLTGLAQGNVPSFTYLAAGGRPVELLLESVLETQRRMMERRGKTLTPKGEGLVKSAFRSTAAERKAAGVRKGKIS